MLGELALAREALDAGDLADQLGGAQGAATDELEQLLRLLFEQRLELAGDPHLGALLVAADERHREPVVPAVRSTYRCSAVLKALGH